MLGRLGMTIKQCEEAYDDISKRVFGAKVNNWTPWNNNEKIAFSDGAYMYDGDKLVDAVRELVAKHLPAQDVLMTDTKENACKVYVCVFRVPHLFVQPLFFSYIRYAYCFSSRLCMSFKTKNVSNGNNAVHLRSYIGKEVYNPYADWKIWEVARATSAAPVYFKSYERNGVEYVDGGLWANCPILE